jgi:pimeloyl-ACP methyl ester carboxylesterase
MSEDEVSRFENYVYHVIAQPGSGEFALKHLLAPLAWAKVPLEDRLLDLKVPVTFIYGDEDWMRPEPAQRALDKLRKIRQGSKGEGKGEGDKGGKLVASDLSIVKTPSSGHWPFIDQPSVFLQQVAEACGPHISKEEKQAVVDAANALPFFTGPAEDTAEEMAADMVEHPIKTEQKIASDM